MDQRHYLSALSGQANCPRVSLISIYATLTVIDSIIVAITLFQLLRLFIRSRSWVCNRQKVFLCLMGASNLGYALYFILTPVAKCGGWQCWSHACGFLVMAIPQILFLATFLLLLSFWLDLCHQATDREDEEEEENDYVVLPALTSRDLSKRRTDSSWRWCPHWRFPRIRSRQKFVIGVVLLIFLLTAAFAILIWIGMGDDNSINSATLSQIYSDIFAVVLLISGGGLAGYGLVLYQKIKRVRSESASQDLRKVAGLAVVSVVCFSLQSFLVLFTDIPAWRFRRDGSPVLLFLYYFIGESIPSVFVLWVMRDLHSRSSPAEYPRLTVTDIGIVPDETLIQQWMDAHQETSAGIITSKRFSTPTAQVDSTNHRNLLF
ncbi:hypothetical protein GOP47_0021076 [Adiantum capillus-veneris]|uniref:THH1/TOM1/TOM3 domain-containing protein n=1 Tax=Adiantum capillus-veneris TaxID=13818 RepID=A0A9D4Z9B5_ADICA|nr:hypothetical protein GOP47_0021076 [Adiantum capillus-veneris]